LPQKVKKALKHLMILMQKIRKKKIIAVQQKPAPRELPQLVEPLQQELGYGLLLLVLF
jgi:hypothetical protein